MISKNALRLVATDYARSMVGRPYRWGGDDPMGGFDCSGLAQEVLAGVGMDLSGDQTADGLYRAFKRRSVASADGAWPMGCLVFYGTERKITHVGVSIGNGLMVEAGGGGSSTLTAQDAESQNAFVRIRPIGRRSDFVAVCDPFG